VRPSLPVVALLLLLVAAAAAWPQLRLEDWTGTEGRRVQIAVEMAQSGDYMVPTLSHEPTFAKPPLHYWLLCGARALFGEGYVALRLPSVLLLWGLAVLGFWLHRRTFGDGAAWVAALGVLCAPLAIAQFPSAEIDPPFACLCAASLWCLAVGAGEERRGVLIAGGALGGLALLEKGPPYFMFAAGALLVWWRHRRCRGVLAFALPLLLVPLCYYAPLLLLRAASAAVTATAKEQTFDRLFTWQWKHVVDTPLFWMRAFGAQVPLVLWCFWEWRSTRDARMSGRDLVLRMCSAAAVFAVAVLTCFPAKPTRYLLPNVPLFAFAVAPAVAHYARQRRALGRFSHGVLTAIGLCGALLLVLLPFLPAPFPGRAPVAALVAALLPFAVRTPRGFVASLLLLPVVFGWTVLDDHARYWPATGRLRAGHGPLLRRELDALGATPADVATFGHVHGGLLLGMGLLPKGEEEATRQPTARFVLREDDRDPPLPKLVHYRERLRLCLPSEIFVVEERNDR
jgi:4-amino-4-deoxy-L-arabinose transferase-like glycosyltransferase